MYQTIKVFSASGGFSCKIACKRLKITSVDLDTGPGLVCRVLAKDQSQNFPEKNVRKIKL
jgi:hypothetical protein